MPDRAAAGWLANIGMTWQPLNSTFVGARLDHVGDRALGGDFDLVDLTVSRQDVFVRGLGVRLGVKDALNDHPVYLIVRPVGAPEQMTFPGRSVWFQLSWRR